MSHASAIAVDWVEQGLVPDGVVRAAIRRLSAHRLEEIGADDGERVARDLEAFIAQMDASPIALVPELANEQHYEVPAGFFELALGARRKYSSCWWGEGIATLDQAEDAALALTCDRAGLRDGMQVLELGCGWGSLTLWMAERYPGSGILAVSNSRSQAAHIRAEAARRNLGNVTVVTEDMNRFDAGPGFDRVVSVEMFEHMRNWRALFARVHEWLRPGGRFFLHVFCHRAAAYPFVARDASDWMSRHFFSGGMMPSDDLALRFQDRLRVVQRWRWDGRHYEKTANAWLANLDRERVRALRVLAATHGEDAASRWLQRWRIFFMACAELFGYRGGQEWWVSHSLLERPAR